MLIFEMNPFEPFSDIISIMHRFGYFAGCQCNPNMFSIIGRHSYPPSVITLTILPQFFTRFSCDQNHYIQFSIDDFFFQFLIHKQRGYDSFTFCLAEFRPHMALEFHSSHVDYPSPQLLRTWLPYRYELSGKINYGSFVSLDLQDFRHLILCFDSPDTYVMFSVTNSEAKFYVADREVLFTTEIDRCIIGGIREGEEFRGAISVNPREAYFNFTSKRLWLFESYDPSGITLVAPLGLYTNISTYFPQLFPQLLL